MKYRNCHDENQFSGNSEKMNTYYDFYTIKFEDFSALNPSLKSKVFFDNKLIVLKSDHPVSIEKVKTLCSSFGKLYQNKKGNNFFIDKDPFVLRISNNSNSKDIKGLFHNFPLHWHNDFAHTLGDFHGTALYNYRNGEKAQTQFIDTQEAYNGLETSIKKRYENLCLPHKISKKSLIEKALSSAEDRLLKMKQYKINGYFPHNYLNDPVMRPLFPTHPVTKKQSIYLSPTTVDSSFLGKDYSSILNHCLKYMKSFTWDKYDLLLIDNLSLMHARSAFSGDRELHRIQFNYENAK